jgi:hypothetical protein
MYPALHGVSIVFWICVAFPFLCAFIFKRFCSSLPNLLKVPIVGVLPAFIIILCLLAWHIQLRMEYDRAPDSVEGFIGPLWILLFGLPMFVVYLIFSFIIAYWARNWE